MAATMKTAFPSFDLFRYRGRFTEVWATEGVEFLGTRRRARDVDHRAVTA